MKDIVAVIMEVFAGGETDHIKFVELKSNNKETTVQLEISNSMDEIHKSYCFLMQYSVDIYLAEIRRLERSRNNELVSPTNAAQETMFPDDINKKYDELVAKEQAKIDKIRVEEKSYAFIIDRRETKNENGKTKIKFSVSRAQAIFFLDMKNSISKYDIMMKKPTEELQEDITSTVYESNFITIPTTSND